jgi:hypothetical protein
MQLLLIDKRLGKSKQATVGVPQLSHGLVGCAAAESAATDWMPAETTTSDG